MSDAPHRAGYVAIVGRPNVGKSTLLNALVGTKVAIVSPKPQTTRNRIVGIRTVPGAQLVFVDTPGIHAARSPLNRRIVEVANAALGDADAAIFVLDATTGVGPGDRDLAMRLAALGRPLVAVLNKLDRVRPPDLLPVMQALGALLPGRDVIPASARDGAGVDTILGAAVQLLPASPRLFPEDDWTTETERFLVQETVREQLFLQLADEVPYGTAVVVEHFEEKPERNVLVLNATILVDRPTHKAIVIGSGGQRLKDVGSRARVELERLFGVKVFLELFVKVEPGWARDPRRLRELGL
jgi:GTP-binding protein Era